MEKKGQTYILYTATKVMRKNDPKTHINSTKTKSTILDGRKANPVTFRWKSECFAFVVRPAARSLERLGHVSGGTFADG